jgi:hypothetical protein
MNPIEVMKVVGVVEVEEMLIIEMITVEEEKEANLQMAKVMAVVVVIVVKLSLHSELIRNEINYCCCFRLFLKG